MKYLFIVVAVGTQLMDQHWSVRLGAMAATAIFLGLVGSRLARLNR